MDLKFATDEERRDLLRLCEVIRSGDGSVLVEFAIKAVDSLIPQLLAALTAAESKDGGRFGEQMREALREEFMREWNGKSCLKGSVKVDSFHVVVVGEAKIVTTRLRIGEL